MKKKVIYYVGHYGGFYISLLHKAQYHRLDDAYYIYVRTYSSEPVNSFMDRVSSRPTREFGTVLCMNEELFWGLENEEATRDQIIKHYDEIFNRIGIPECNECDIYMFFDEFNSLGIYLTYKNIHLLYGLKGKKSIINTSLERLVSYVDMYLFNEVEGRQYYAALQRKCRTLDKDGIYVDRVIRTYGIENISEDFLKENRRRQEAIDNAQTYDYFDVVVAEKELTDQQKGCLLHIFECDKVHLEMQEYNLLLLSSNFTGFKLHTTQEEFVCGNQILADYILGNQSLAVKPHPRADFGKEVWERAFPGSCYIPSYLPAEYMEVLGIKVNQLLSTGSTGSGYVSRIAKKKINFGRNYWWNFRYIHQIFAILNLAAFIGRENIICINFPEEIVRALVETYPNLQVFTSIRESRKITGDMPNNSMLIIKSDGAGGNSPFGINKKDFEKLLCDGSKRFVVALINIERNCDDGIWNLPDVKYSSVHYIVKKKKIAASYCDMEPERFSVFSSDIELREQLLCFSSAYVLKRTGVSIEIVVESGYLKEEYLKDTNRVLLSSMQSMERALGRMTEKMNVLMNFRMERLQLIDTFELYLSELSKLDVLIIISVRDTPGFKLTPAMAKKINQLGLVEDLSSRHWYSYLAVIYEHKVLFEELNKDSSICFETCILDQEILSKSAALPHGNVSHISIGGREFSMNLRGLNIVVYDCRERHLIDSVCFDTHVLGIPCYRNRVSVL